MAHDGDEHPRQRPPHAHRAALNVGIGDAAAFAGVPMLDRFADDVTALIRTGDELLVEPEMGRVTILNR